MHLTVTAVYSFWVKLASRTGVEFKVPKACFDIPPTVGNVVTLEVGTLSEAELS